MKNEAIMKDVRNSGGSSKDELGSVYFSDR